VSSVSKKVGAAVWCVYLAWIQKTWLSWASETNYDDKTVLVSTDDDDCMLDLTEDNTSVGSGGRFDLDRSDFFFH
jgi:hypothetical protein